MSYEIYTSMLKMHDTFRPSSFGAALTCDFTSSRLTVLREQYDLPAIAGEGDTLTRAMRVMDWLTAHIRHNGSFNFQEGHIPLRVFEFAFDRADRGVNCTTLARTLSACLLSLGIAARPVGIYPFAPYDGDNHFVTECWCPESDRWVMLDPTVNTCVRDETGTPLSCLDVRAALADQQPVTFSDGLRYNGAPYTAEEHRDYLAKDLFYLQFPTTSSYGAGGTSFVYLCPEGYDCQKRDVLNIQWRMRQYGEADWIREWLTATRKENRQYISPKAAYRAPF